MCFWMGAYVSEENGRWCLTVCLLIPSVFPVNKTLRAIQPGRPKGAGVCRG